MTSVGVTCYVIFYSCNVGTSDLPDMYSMLKTRGHTYQASHECPFYKCYVKLPVRLIALMSIQG